MHNKAIALGLFSSFLLVAVPQVALSQDQGTPKQTISAADLAKPPDGTVRFEATQFRLILGGGSGEGVLTFQGKDYPFTMKGGSVGGVGYTEVQGAGVVHFLKKVEDFAGTYSGIGVGAALVEGKGASTFQNNKGVVVSVKSRTDGAALNMGVNAVTVKLANQ